MKDQTTEHILLLTSYPTRECGLATYSKDLVTAIKNKFSPSVSIKVCALNEEDVNRKYPDEVIYTLNTSRKEEYALLAEKINQNDAISSVFIQHEFGLFGGTYGDDLFMFLMALSKPVQITFHTVLPSPDKKLLSTVKLLEVFCSKIVVMTERSKEILIKDYTLDPDNIAIIPHGTHVVKWNERDTIKLKYGLKDKMILSNFGLLNSNKSIETAIRAIPAIKEKFPNVMYLVLGKTHPTVVRNEGEIYREKLQKMVHKMNLHDNVKFVNEYLSLNELLEFLRMTDVYLFTSKDRNQAVSGTFSYALSCGCPIVSTRIPHAEEILSDDCGALIDFDASDQLAEATIQLLSNEQRRIDMSRNILHKMRRTSWENSAIAHMQMLKELPGTRLKVDYKLPAISLKHLFQLTDERGIIQFSDIAHPDVKSGYTLDDNARALISVCKYAEKTGEPIDLRMLKIYLNFITHCQLPDGTFMNYVDKNGTHTEQNRYINLDDSNGRAIWALGTLLSCPELTESKLMESTERIFLNAVNGLQHLSSPRAMSFMIKGLYQYNKTRNDLNITNKIDRMAYKLCTLFKNEVTGDWKWFESKMTYANAVIPEAMLYAYLETGNKEYRSIAKASMDFLLSKTLNRGMMSVISNRGWMEKGSYHLKFGEQPIDVAYTIFALELFSTVYGELDYREKMKSAFDWFLGHNRLGKVMYNSATGGCYDGLEEHDVNLNQGAESTVCYLLARLTLEPDTAKFVSGRLLNFRFTRSGRKRTSGLTWEN